MIFVHNIIQRCSMLIHTGQKFLFNSSDQLCVSNSRKTVQSWLQYNNSVIVKHFNWNHLDCGDLPAFQVISRTTTSKIASVPPFGIGLFYTSKTLTLHFILASLSVPLLSRNLFGFILLGFVLRNFFPLFLNNYLDCSPSLLTQIPPLFSLHLNLLSVICLV